MLKIENMEQLNVLKSNGFNEEYTRRQFIVNDTRLLQSLIESYIIGFAFKVRFCGKDFSFFKYADTISIVDCFKDMMETGERKSRPAAIYPHATFKHSKEAISFILKRPV